MSDAVRIGILGDFNTEFRSHHATNDAIQHAARKLKIEAQSEWLPTPSLLEPDAAKRLESFDGLWASAGSPYKSFDGMLAGIQFARTRDWPFLGTCGGFQYTLIECARNVVGLKDADSAENDSGSENIVIYPVSCAVPNRKKNAPKLSGWSPRFDSAPAPTSRASTEKMWSKKNFSAISKSTPTSNGLRLKPDSPSRPAAATAKCAPSSPPRTVSS